jgi:hypothetical protein
MCLVILTAIIDVTFVSLIALLATETTVVMGCATRSAAVGSPERLCFRKAKLVFEVGQSELTIGTVKLLLASI